jgi:hypothetical protein
VWDAWRKSSPTAGAKRFQLLHTAFLKKLRLQLPAAAGSESQEISFVVPLRTNFSAEGIALFSANTAYRDIR